MKRILLLASALALLAACPATAHAARFTGAVIAKDAKRKALVTASRGGVVRTLRAPRAFKRVRLGARVAVSAARLPDGTYAAAKLRVQGRAKHVRFRAIVVKSEGARRVIVSAGRSVFSVRLKPSARLTAFNHDELGPGDEISCDADIDDAGLEADPNDLDQVGHVDKLELEGIYLATADDGTLELAVVHRGRVFVSVPDGVDVPDFNPGDEVVLLVSVEPDGSFSLIRAENEDGSDGGDGGDGVDMDGSEFWVYGILAELTPTAVAVKVEQHPEPVRCEVRSDTDLTGFAVGQLVKMHCRFDGGRFVLVELRSKSAELPSDGDGQFTVSGFIAALTTDKIAVKVQGHDDPVTCLLHGQDLTGFAVGEFVEMHCHYYNGMWKLAALKSDHAAFPEDGQAWFTLSGAITEIDPGYALYVQVAHHTDPVPCKLPDGMDLSGFAVGDAVEMHCHYVDGRFYLAALKSQNAVIPEDGMPQFTLQGVLSAIGVDSVAVQVTDHPEPVRCAFPAGTSLAGFAVGDLVEMHCHFHDGRYNLAYLKSAHAYLKLED